MNRYLFIFGFETPAQFQYNSEAGTDDEDSIAFFVDAPDESAAVDRGRSIAHEFVRRMFAAVDMDSPWSPGNYANWIEHRPLDRLSGLALETLDVIGPMDSPDYANWLGGHVDGEINP